MKSRRCIANLVPSQSTERRQFPMQAQVVCPHWVNREGLAIGQPLSGLPLISDINGSIGPFSGNRRHRFTHSITLSATARSDAGTTRPSALAVFRLMDI